MKAAVQRITRRLHLLPLITTFVFASTANAATQLLLARDARPQGEFKGIVALTVTPPAENMKVSITVDGDKIADALLSPYRVTVDFGPRVVEHKIGVTAVTPDRKRVQWQP